MSQEALRIRNEAQERRAMIEEKIRSDAEERAFRAQIQGEWSEPPKRDPWLILPPLGMPGRALTLHQPWATLLVHGYKTIETRSWGEHVAPGWIVIHSSATFRREHRQLCLEEPFKTDLAAINPNYVRWNYLDDPRLGLPRGQLIGMGYLRCTSMAHSSIELRRHMHKDAYPREAQARDAAYGNFGIGRTGWLFESLTPFREHLHVNGRMQLWRLDEVAMAWCAAQAQGTNPALVVPGE